MRELDRKHGRGAEGYMQVNGRSEGRKVAYVALALLRVLLVHISQQGVESSLSLPGERRSVEGGFLTIDQLNEEKLPEIIRVLENWRAG